MKLFNFQKQFQKDENNCRNRNIKSNICGIYFVQKRRGRKKKEEKKEFWQRKSWKANTRGDLSYYSDSQGTP